MIKSFKYFITFSILILSVFSMFSCEDAPTYEAEITVIDFINKKVKAGAIVKTGIKDAIPTKDLLDDIEQSGVTDANGKVKFKFKHKANIFFDIEVPGENKTGSTNIKLQENETIKKKVLVYLP
ncbi:MAG: hypothetical protein ACPGSD_04060 [Flavobacteriales bacterium]